jgi:hypothetical protein
LPALPPTALRGVAEIQRRSPGDKRLSPDSGIERHRRDGRPGSLLTVPCGSSSLTGTAIQGQDWTNPDQMIYVAGE